MSETGWTWDTQFQQARIDELHRKYTDAQATIAALQAQLKEQSEKLKYHDLFKQWQCWRDPDELVDEYEKWQAAIQEHQSLKDQLTQRTAERDTARRRVDELEAREVDVVLLRDDLEQRTAELEAVSNFIGVKYDAESKTWVSGQSPYLSAGTTKQEACIAAIDALRLVCDTWETKYRDLQAELERVRDQYADLSKLIKALPKVEGEITATRIPCSAAIGEWWYVGWIRFPNERTAQSYVDLLKHRQGMEG